MSREQRESEIERGIGEIGTTNYKKRGCYNIKKLVKDCKTYTPLKKIF